MKGQHMSRSKHKFRPSCDVFEERFLLTVTALPPSVPFTPPGQVGDVAKPPGWNWHSYSPETGWFSISDDKNSISTSVTNGTGEARYVTVAIYTAPGGGSGDILTGDFNLRSHKLVYSETHLVQPGETLQVTLHI